MALIDYLLASGVAGAGVGIGWWLRGNTVKPATPTSVPNTPEKTEAGAENARRAQEALGHLHELAARVAADVGSHSRSVREINDELTSSEGATAESVVAAVEKLMRVNSAMEEKLQAAEQRLVSQAREIESHAAEARTDGLTGLNNRRSLDDELNRRVAESRRQGRPLSFMMVDVDHFKKFNDTHGHQAGDAVLKGVARVLKSAAREMDFVARYGGEEFAVLFPGATLDEARRAAERMRSAITAASFPFNDITLRVTSSAGIAQLLSGESGELLLKRADEALYSAKKAGRNRGHYHDGENMLPIVAEVKPPANTPSQPISQSSIKPMPLPTGETKPSRETPAAVAVPSEVVDAVVASRLVFTEDVQRRVAEWKRGGATVSVLLVQIDDFELQRNRADSAAADMVVQATCKFIQATMREMDHVGRFDDSTFALLLPGAPLTASVKVAERLRKAVERTQLKHEGHTITFTVSVGAVEIEQGHDSERLLRRAEEALLAAQTAGRNRTCYDQAGECHQAENMLATGN